MRKSNKKSFDRFATLAMNLEDVTLGVKGIAITGGECSQGNNNCSDQPPVG